jgi:hypothetical protein
MHLVVELCERGFCVGTQLALSEVEGSTRRSGSGTFVNRNQVESKVKQEPQEPDMGGTADSRVSS